MSNWNNTVFHQLHGHVLHRKTVIAVQLQCDYNVAEYLLAFWDQ